MAAAVAAAWPLTLASVAEAVPRARVAEALEAAASPALLVVVVEPLALAGEGLGVAAVLCLVLVAAPPLQSTCEHRLPSHL